MCLSHIAAHVVAPWCDVLTNNRVFVGLGDAQLGRTSIPPFSSTF